ncbi:Csu type fimbrial protein [Acinetobacter indicus]|uniref:Csu type fimbrial protein n=1 Tax=Acinetobacter indicus TaxID=756892 RepID=UPI000CEC5266|nr:spore coat U domain-containing protein [Acinetobacter indicus]
MNKLGILIGFGIIGFATSNANALIIDVNRCSADTQSARLGPVSSLNVNSLGISSVSGGLKCGGGIFSLLVNQFIKYDAVNIPNFLTHTDGVNRAKITIFDVDRNVVTSNISRDISRIDLLGLFSGPNENVPFYVRVDETTGLKPGTYRASYTMRWYYHIVHTGVWTSGTGSKSNGIELNFLGTGVNSWGTGVPSTINIELIVEKDCKINAQNINFGTAPLVSKFNPVTGTVQITCSAQTPYTVGLSNGQNYSQNRRMKNLSSNHYLPYEIYKNTTTQRWGYLGAERWSSANASQNPGVYDGSVTQGYAYTAKIIDDGSNASVEGTYKDNLILEVAF